MFLFHIIFFFVCIAFSVGTAQAYVDEDARESRARRQQLEEAPPMVRLYRLKFEKLLDNMFEGLRMFCLCFWGPIILVECIYTMTYYPEILTGCIDHITDGFMNVMVYVLMIFFLVGLFATIFICYSLFLIGRKIKSLWPEIRNARQNAQNLPDEEAQSMFDRNSRRNSINDDFDIPNNNVYFSQGDLARARLASIIASE